MDRQKLVTTVQYKRLANFPSLSPRRLNISISLQVKGLAKTGALPAKPGLQPGQLGQPDTWPSQPFFPYQTNQHLAFQLLSY
jgi:hypothetical protein